MTPKKSYKYVILLILQIILVVLFFVFGKYAEQPEKAPGFEGTHVMIFIGFGFLMTFLKKYSYSALGFNWLLAALVVQWAMIIQNAFHMQNLIITISRRQMIEADIMAATVLISFGAMLGVASGTQLIFIAMIETVLACTNMYLVVDMFKAADAGGSITIHAFGAYFGLACSYAMNVGKEKKEVLPKLDEPTYITDITATLGSIFLWIYWPSFNSGIVLSDTEADRAVVNTYLALAAATVTTFAMSSLTSHDEGKFDMVHVQNSTLAGGVAVGAVANMFISPGAAVAIGTAAGIISVCGYKYLSPKLTRCGVLDTCGVHNLHGMPAILSGILSVVFAVQAKKDVYKDDMGLVFQAMGNNTDMIHGKVTERTVEEQAYMQLAALGATLGNAIIGGILVGLLMKLKWFKPLAQEVRYNDEIDWELPN